MLATDFDSNSCHFLALFFLYTERLSNLSLMIIFTRTLGWRVSFPLRQLNEIGFPISGIGIKIDITTLGASREGDR